MRLALPLTLALALLSCKKPQAPSRPLELTGYTLDGQQGIDVSTLRGKPWVLNIWRPG